MQLIYRCLDYNHAITVQILTFRLVTLKVAHQFDVLLNVFEAFQLPTVVNDLHGVLQSLRRPERRVQVLQLSKRWSLKSTFFI